MLLSNSWLKYLKSCIPKFLTKLSDEELQNWNINKNYVVVNSKAHILFQSICYNIPFMS